MQIGVSFRDPVKWTLLALFGNYTFKHSSFVCTLKRSRADSRQSEASTDMSPEFASLLNPNPRSWKRSPQHIQHAAHWFDP